MQRDVIQAGAISGPAMRWHALARGLVHLDSGEVRVGDDIVCRLSPKATQLLAVFIAHPDRVLSRDQILALAWASQPRTDDAVTKVIAELRRTLAVCCEEGVELIETLPKRGYRWHAPKADANDLTPTIDVPGQIVIPTRKLPVAFASSLAAGVVLALVAALLALQPHAAEDPDSAPPSPWTQPARPLSASIADEAGASISADGLRVISSERDAASGHYALIERSRDGAVMRLLRIDAKADLRAPTTSRNERWLAWRRHGASDCRIQVSEIGASTARDLGACPPDNDAAIEFATDDRSLIVSAPVASAAGGTWLQMVQIALDDGARTPYRIGGHAVYGKDIRFSADGSLALVRQFDRFEALLLINLASGHRQPVFAGGNAVAGYDFEASGTHALLSANLDGQLALWRLRLADGDLVKTAYRDADSPRIARAADVLVFRSQTRRAQLVMTDAAGTQVAFASTRNESAPAQSVGGRWLAFVSDRNGKDEVYVADQRDGNVKRLTDDPDFVPEFVAFTADARELLVQLRSGQMLDYRLIDRESGQVRKLALAHPQNIDLRPSARAGEFLYVAYRDRRPHIYLHHEHSGASTPLTHCEGRAPRMGDDGWLYFLSADQRALRRARANANSDCETLARALSVDQVRMFASGAPFAPDAFLQQHPSAQPRLLASNIVANGDLMWVDGVGATRVMKPHDTAGAKMLASAR